MDHRHAIAYFVLALMVAGLAAAFLLNSREWRSKRRASRKFERHRVARRDEAKDSSEEA